MRLQIISVLGVAGIALLASSCSHRKDGVIVEVSDELANSGVVVRDWRRAGMGVLDVQIFTDIAIPAEAWTLAAYDKNGNLLTSGRIAGPRARERDTVWIKVSTPYKDLFDKTDRVIIGADLSPRPAPKL